MKQTNEFFLTKYYNNKKLSLVKEEGSKYLFIDRCFEDKFEVEALSIHSEVLENLNTLKDYQFIFVEEYGKRLELWFTTQKDIQFLVEFWIEGDVPFLSAKVRLLENFQYIHANSKTMNIASTPENNELLLACLAEFQQITTRFKKLRLDIMFIQQTVANLFFQKEEQIKELNLKKTGQK